MVEFSLHKNLARRPPRTFVGSLLLALHVLGPPTMFYLYYKAILCGSLPCAVISIIQIFVQFFTRKQRWFIELLQACDIELYFDNFTFEVEDGGKIIDDSKSLFAAHPHGIFSLGMFLNNYRDHFGRNAAALGSRLVMLTPIMGLLHQLGGLESVDPNSLKRIMKTGRNIALLPGGFEEATLTCQTENRVFIKSRKGFVKYSMRYGYNIFPTFTFGENKTFKTLDRFLSFRLWLNKLKLVGVIFWSSLIFLPEYKIEIRTVVGKPIIVPQDDNPSDEIVEKYHQIYIQRLKDLHRKYSIQYNIKEPLVLY